MKPVKIKYWGLFWLSKRGYLLFNGIGWLVVTGLAAVAVLLNYLPPLQTLWRHEARWGVYNYFWWLFLACIALQFIDAGVAWMKFAKREEEQERLHDWLDEHDARADEPLEVREVSDAIQAQDTDIRRSHPE